MKEEEEFEGSKQDPPLSLNLGKETVRTDSMSCQAPVDRVG